MREDATLTGASRPRGDLPAPLAADLAAWQERRAARVVLFVGGGCHGTLREVRPEDRHVILVESLDENDVPTPIGLSSWPADASPVRILRAQYRREEYSVAVGDTATTVEVWLHEDVAAGTPSGDRLVAGAALLALASTGTVDSLTRPRPLGWTT